MCWWIVHGALCRCALPLGQREGQGASPPGYSGALLGCPQQKMNLQVAQGWGWGALLIFLLQIVLGVTLSTKCIKGEASSA